MGRVERIPVFFLTVSALVLLSVSQPADQLQSPKPELPVLITSCGQSPGADMLKVIFMRLKLEEEPQPYEVKMMATSADLKARKESGSPYKSLIIVMGASLKGMGAAGISIDDELERTRQLMAEARNQGITLIGAHIEGMKRRSQGAAVGDNTDELSIDAVAPNMDLLIINKDGNTDNRFTVIAEQKNIPMIEVEKNLELLQKLGELFRK